MFTNTTYRYGLIHILLHWITALSVIGLFVVGLWMVDLTYYSQWYHKAPHLHKSVGLLLAAVTLFRLIWKTIQTKPSPIGNPIENRIAAVAHTVLYMVLIAIFATGYLISTADGHSISIFDWVNIPSMGRLFAEQEDIAGQVHEWLAYGLIGLTLLHALAAFKHHFIDKDETLKRITRLTTGEN